jgi:hypothetical protein
MRKILYILPLILTLLTLSSVHADNYQVNISFWQDMEMTSPYINEFMYVYTQHRTCQSYELGGLNCTYECRHGRYASATATIDNVTGGLVWDFLILQPASFDNDTACPRKINPIIDYQFDQKVISSNASYNYFLNATVLPEPSPTSFSFSTYLNIGYWILTLIVIVVAGYYTNNGWACLIAFVVMVIIKLLLFA